MTPPATGVPGSTDSTADLGIDPATVADFVAARATAQTFLAALPGKLQGLSSEQQQLREQGWPAQARRAELDRRTRLAHRPHRPGPAPTT